MAASSQSTLLVQAGKPPSWTVSSHTTFVDAVPDTCTLQPWGLILACAAKVLHVCRLHGGQVHWYWGKRTDIGVSWARAVILGYIIPAFRLLIWHCHGNCHVVKDTRMLLCWPRLTFWSRLWPGLCQMSFCHVSLWLEFTTLYRVYVWPYVSVASIF